MVLDISAIRAEDGGDPAKIKKLQTDRFKVILLRPPQDGTVLDLAILEDVRGRRHPAQACFYYKNTKKFIAKI